MFFFWAIIVLRFPSRSLLLSYSRLSAGCLELLDTLLKLHILDQILSPLYLDQKKSDILLVKLVRA